MKTLTIGPLFTRYAATVAKSATICPLGFEMQWASAVHMSAIGLFRYRPKHAADRLRLEQIVFEAERAILTVTCCACHVVETAWGTYLPLEALISELYAKDQVGANHGRRIEL